MNDQQIIQGLKEKEKSIISYVIEILREPVGYKLRSQGASQDIIDNITIDFLLALIERLQSEVIHLKSASFVTYATRACYYMWLHHQETSRKTVLVDDDVLFHQRFDAPKDILELIDLNERHRSLLNALEQLGFPCKIIAELRLFTSKSWDTIATEININPNNIRRKGQSCLNKLFKIWQRHYP